MSATFSKKILSGKQELHNKKLCLFLVLFYLNVIFLTWKLVWRPTEVFVSSRFFFVLFCLFPILLLHPTCFFCCSAPVRKQECVWKSLLFPTVSFSSSPHNIHWAARKPTQTFTNPDMHTHTHKHKVLALRLLFTGPLLFLTCTDTHTRTHTQGTRLQKGSGMHSCDGASQWEIRLVNKWWSREGKMCVCALMMRRRVKGVSGHALFAIKSKCPLQKVRWHFPFRFIEMQESSSNLCLLYC